MAARSACLCSYSLPGTLASPFFRRKNGFCATFLQFNRFTSTGRLTSSTNPLMAVRSQAKRGFTFKKDEIATPADLRFEAPLEIVRYPDPILRAKNKRIDTFDENLKKLVDEMFDVMYKTDGIGLSAPQVGINVRLMVFNSVGERGEGEETVLVNPRVNKYSKKIVRFNEGCLSFPGIYADVERPESIKIDARDINGASFSVNLSGLPARIFQHEFDHLQGILFFDRMTDEVLENIRPQLQVGRSEPVVTPSNSTRPWKRNMRIRLDSQAQKGLKHAKKKRLLPVLGNNYLRFIRKDQSVAGAACIMPRNLLS